jgi:type IV secretion system protein VirB9
MSHDSSSFGAAIVALMALAGAMAARADGSSTAALPGPKVVFAASAVMPNAGGDARLRIVEYHPDRVLPLTAFVGYHVHLAFASDERFVSLGAGDTASLDVGAEGNHLLLKPKLPTAGTNLTILTNRRVYFIDYRAFARAPRPEEAVYSIEFRYPPASEAASEAAFNAGSGSDGIAVTATRAGRPAAEVPGVDSALARPAQALNNNYWYCGSDALRPTAAADDGVQLRLRFAPRTELPAIYVNAADGAESLVNTHVENDTLVVHRLAPRFVLRRGPLVGCIVDRNERTRLRRAESGTVNESVRRETRVIAP